MIYDFPLRWVGLATGLLLLVTHGIALMRPAPVMAWLKKFPRSRPLGIILCTIAAAWAFWLAATMDLGEFTPNRTLICGAIIACAIMVPIFADEFLAVRSLGMLALLAAEPLLSSAFLKPELSRLLLVSLAYAWIIIGLLIVGAPYLLRDTISFLTSRPIFFRLAALGGATYGSLLILVSLLFFTT